MSRNPSESPSGGFLTPLRKPLLRTQVTRERRRQRDTKLACFYEVGVTRHPATMSPPSCSVKGGSLFDLQVGAQVINRKHTQSSQVDLLGFGSHVNAQLTNPPQYLGQKSDWISLLISLFFLQKSSPPVTRILGLPLAVIFS